MTGNDSSACAGTWRDPRCPQSACPCRSGTTRSSACVVRGATCLPAGVGRPRAADIPLAARRVDTPPAHAPGPRPRQSETAPLAPASSWRDALRPVTAVGAALLHDLRRRSGPEVLVGGADEARLRRGRSALRQLRWTTPGHRAHPLTRSPAPIRTHRLTHLGLAAQPPPIAPARPCPSWPCPSESGASPSPRADPADSRVGPALPRAPQVPRSSPSSARAPPLRGPPRASSPPLEYPRIAPSPPEASPGTLGRPLVPLIRRGP